MKKKSRLTILVSALLLSLCAASACAESWEEFAARMREQEKIESEGAPLLARMALLAPEGSDYDLWRLSCEAKSAETRARASVALVKKMFPEGDPANWEKVSGFFPSRSLVPKQLVAVNALFNAVMALQETEGGDYAAAYLMKRFGKSAMGKLYFIDRTPTVFRTALDELLSRTELGGVWETSVTDAPYPFAPRYGGIRTYTYAESRNLQFLDGAACVANYGPYAWDRTRGTVYKLVDRSRPTRFDIF